MEHAPTLQPPAWLDRRAYPFESRTIDLSAGRLHFVDEGTGDPWLFVHGTPSWSFEYRHLIQAMRGSVRAIALDLLGFGLSERPRQFPYTPEAHSAVLREFVNQLDLQRFTLVAHDFGGPIALPLALEGRVSRLVLLNTWSWPIDEDRAGARNARLLGGALGRVLYRHANLSLRVLMPMAYGNRRALTGDIHAHYTNPFRNPADRELVLHRLARSLTESRSFFAHLWDGADRLRELPVLLIWGMRDPAFGPAYLHKWRAHLPQARVISLDRAGHWPHEEDPTRVVAAIKEFSHVHH